MVMRVPVKVTNVPFLFLLSSNSQQCRVVQVTSATVEYGYRYSVMELATNSTQQ